MTYDQFIETYGQELGECMYLCALVNGDGTVVLEASDLEPVTHTKQFSYLDYSW